ncbi:MAG: AAA family ATPase [Caldilineaceae bacterium]|nr:AAA family ATPase [Caldilineaceae bacterium]MBP8108874.1 AAA family ATPase [Caldilineaceae bacterium]MBP8124816.1 AAA family ATPase [Caldilineaceae bacterium]MBP9074451.1 AAA family ATPase [Caldilineaceae bacterium]
MKIERFRVQNYKNLKDVTVEGLSDINVFFGQNSVGKSNTFEALALALWLLNARAPKSTVSLDSICQKLAIAAPVMPLDGNEPLSFQITVRWEGKDVSGRATEVKSSIPSEKRLICDIRIAKEPKNDIVSTISHSWENEKGQSVQFPDDNLLPFVPLLHTIHAYRRLGIERQGPGNGTIAVSHDNLKKALFYAYLSSDPRQKRRLEAIRRILADPPFEFGLLDVALNPETDAIDIGFVRPEGRLPIESLGSGFQQLLLVLGQVFLNDSPIVALEEPEMNLSPQNQQHLLGALRRLMQDPAIALEQLFISTHSPYFEFAENFYDVTLDKQGHTQVDRATPQKHDRHFAIAPVGPETGARLNSLNQIQLYQDVLDDLNLQRGDMVFFVKGEAGRWEIYPEEEVLAAMKDAWGNDGSGE